MSGPGPAERPSQRTLVIIPTYNERENLPLIVGRVHKALPDVHILIVDDGSPDGTGQLADELALADPDRVHVMHRTSKDGLGAAYLAGFAWGLSREYSVLVEMDADGSHAPEELHRLLDAVDGGADLGDRIPLCPGRSHPQLAASPLRTVQDRQHVRPGVTRRRHARHHRGLPGLPARGAGEDRPAAVDSKGYCFQIDLTWRAINNGFVVVEVPITFTERELGVSKMSGSNIREACSRSRNGVSAGAWIAPAA